MLRTRLTFATVTVVLLALAGCASAPGQINNVCAVFEQKDGWFDNWYVAAKQTEREYGVPVPILMATIRKESGYKANSRPPRTKLFGFIPWKRPSSAYGFSQALDGTWAQYKRETGKYGADRNDFADAVNFIGWYHQQSHLKNGIAIDDAYHLYLAYYFGQSAFARGDWQRNANMQKVARSTAEMANSYAAQLQSCSL
ncbi:MULTISPECIES: hypothetical protein [Phyllobacterium]|jgi:hypothetical protein|uniref:Transglycosylase SLT domain-containing protein n=1 Tax=Phyllobacterium sophorae TaxID=1520277 RepID=A0A2P7B7K6_9HYPH|nr:MULTISPECIES: hypothetical protein [Phyllobacterium]PSH62428.1 hypothetical protein CU103_18940 [Phyllobacterium sophorae]UXN67660.1 hypothetical protein N8E89_27405 [Phyllobacterium sp. A18/5-2]